MSHPLFYWSIAGFLAVWGVAYAGLVVFSFVVSTPEHWASLVADGRIKPEYAQYINAIPKWVIALTAGAALTRLFGGAALVFQSSLALPLYAVSLALVVVIMFRGFVLADVASVIRPSQIALEAAFMALSIFAVWFSHAQINVGRLT